RSWRRALPATVRGSGWWEGSSSFVWPPACASLCFIRCGPCRLRPSPIAREPEDRSTGAFMPSPLRGIRRSCGRVAGGPGRGRRNPSAGGFALPGGLELIEGFDGVARVHGRRACAHVDRHAKGLEHLLARRAPVDGGLGVEGDAVVAADGDADG